MLGLTISLPRRGRGGTSVPLWVPTDLGAQLKAWWNADDPAVGAVTTWTDRVGSLAPTQATSGFRPVKAATSFNSAYAGVTFDGTDDRLSIGATGSLPVGTTGSDIYALVSQDDAGASAVVRDVLAYGSTAASGGRQLIRYTGASVSRLRGYDNTAGFTDTVGNFSGNHIVSARFDAATIYLFLDGVATTPASGASAFNSGALFTSIGAVTSGGSQFWLGIIRHIFVTTVLSVSDRQKLEGWMAWDVGLASLLPVGHPYKSVAP